MENRYKEYYKKNREKIRIKQKIHRDKNKERIKEINKLYYQKNKESIKERVKKYFEKHPDYNSNWAKKNREKRNKYYNERNKLRRKNDALFKIKCNLRNRVYDALKDNIKSKKTLELLGCEIDEFKKFMEIKFQHGMSWGNYGVGWHMDHIKPCSAFDLSKEEEQKKCFNYTNLQPLYKEDNFKKNSFYKGKKY